MVREMRRRGLDIGPGDVRLRRAWAYGEAGDERLFVAAEVVVRGVRLATYVLDDEMPRLTAGTLVADAGHLADLAVLEFEGRMLFGGSSDDARARKKAGRRPGRHHKRPD